MHFTKVWQLNDWEFDIKMYYRYKDIRDTATNPDVISRAQERMEAIKANWPHHQKQFES